MARIITSCSGVNRTEILDPFGNTESRRRVDRITIPTKKTQSHLKTKSLNINMRHNVAFPLFPLGRGGEKGTRQLVSRPIDCARLSHDKVSQVTVTGRSGGLRYSVLTLTTGAVRSLNPDHQSP